MDRDKFFCPNTDCNTVLSFAQTKKLSTGKTWQCKECKVEICKKCQLIAHPGRKCVESNDNVFKMWANTGGKVKNCPSCKSRTQKNSGCNEMSCERCNTKWCWVCNQPCDEFHFEPTNIFSGCPGLQFFGDGGWKLALMLLAVFLLNIPLFIIVPPITGFLAAFYYAGVIVYACIGSCLDRCCWVACILAPLLYIPLWAIAEFLCVYAGAIVAVNLVCFISLPLMLYIIYFSGRLIFLSCKRVH